MASTSNSHNARQFTNVAFWHSYSTEKVPHECVLSMWHLSLAKKVPDVSVDLSLTHRGPGVSGIEVWHFFCFTGCWVRVV